MKLTQDKGAIITASETETDSILIPIYKKYGQRIINGSKLWEIRKHTPHKNIKKIFLYELETNRLIAWFEVGDVFWTEPPYALWTKIRRKGIGISQKEFEDYTSNAKFVIGYQIARLHILMEKDYDLKKELGITPEELVQKKFIYLEVDY